MSIPLGNNAAYGEFSLMGCLLANCATAKGQQTIPTRFNFHISIPRADGLFL